METLISVVSCHYNASSRNLKVVYSNGITALYHPVPKYIYANLLRRQDKLGFIQKYLEYDLSFNKLYCA
jgi:hypothetical protein